MPTLATASVFFHRFYMYYSFDEFPKHITALSCLFLAGKVEETPKKCKDIVAMAKEVYPAIFKEQPIKDPNNPPKTLLEEVMFLEKVLLQTLRFDLHVEHPYDCLMQYAKGFKIDREIVKQVVQNAWTFINDSISTTLCLLWEPEIIAISMLYMSFKIAKIEELDWQDRNANEQWWDVYVANLTIQMMEEICHKVLDFYGRENEANVGAVVANNHVGEINNGNAVPDNGTNSI